ncbi:MAG: M28 family peptidase [Elusimicrobiales bacterium]|nr:M28 family peptidase [Elusimicrobiales bacterium]
MLKMFFFFSFLHCSDVYYNLYVDINPKNNFINVNADIKFTEEFSRLNFYFDKNIQINKTNVSINIVKGPENYHIYEIYNKNNKKIKSFNISYSGFFKYELDGKDEYAKGMKYTKGIISENGCFLSDTSGWYPIFSGRRYYFDITVKIPSEFDVVLPGKLKYGKKTNNFREVRYINSKPVFEIPLVCGKYEKYYLKSSPPIYVYMLNPDEELAKKYLNYSKLYIDMYEKMIGKYPYEKFAVVENFWETGYAFPSFTLLGSSVMRLPFIFVSSLPHEILHNWWGNGVYVDYDKGNWSEGLTTYLSDYLMAEQRGKGVEYRMNVLKKYKDYVSDDIPLNQFYERHSNQTEAVGYGKAMMLFHMIRKIIGDDKFLEGLKIFYIENLYKKASWEDINNAFRKVVNIDLKEFFDSFVNNKYSFSPLLLKESIVIDDNKNVKLKILNNSFNNMKIPLRFIYSNSNFEEYFLSVSSGVNNYIIGIKDELSAICLDCDFDVLRILADSETPITFSKMFAKSKVKVMSEKKLDGLNNFYEVNNIDSDILVGNICLDFIWDNSFVKVNNNIITIDGKSYKMNDYNYVFILPYEKNNFKTFLLCEDKCEIILNKLIHYGKYSYLIFDKEFNVVDSGIWQLKERDNLFLLNRSLPILFSNKFKSLYPYYSFFNIENIKKDLYYLSEKLKTRHPGSSQLLKASYYIEKKFKKVGLKPFFKSSYRQQFVVDINNMKYNLYNICGKTSDDESYILVSAHYDHIFPDINGTYPGANDNASGVSVLLELARVINLSNKKGIIFCAFSGEEFGRSGSDFFVKNLKNEKIVANINIDAVGKVNSNVVVLNHSTSISWKSIIRKASMLSGINYELGSDIVFPGDHLSFIMNTIPAIHIYDGSIEDYHKTTDRISKINFERMLWVCDFVFEIITETKKRGSISFEKSDYPKQFNRKISLGFAPDFSYRGVGVKIKKLNEKSLLHAYGFKDGDIIIAINGYEVKNIYDYMDLTSNIELHNNSISIKCICGNETKEINLIKIYD